METLDLDEYVELEIKSGGVGKIFRVRRISEKNLKIALAREKELREEKDYDKQLEIIHGLLMMLSPESKKSDFAEYSIGGQYKIYFKMVRLAISGHDGEEKKSQEPTRRKYTRSKRRGSPLKK